MYSTDSFKNTDSFRNKSSDCLYESITESFTYSFKTLILSEMKQETGFMTVTLNHSHSFSWYIQNTDLFRNETSDCLYERVIESLNQLIYSKTLIHSEVKLLTGFMVA